MRQEKRSTRTILQSTTPDKNPSNTFNVITQPQPGPTQVPVFVPRETTVDWSYQLVKSC